MNATTLVTRLSDDFRSLSEDAKVLFPNRCMEAHAITKANGRYWYLASGCTGWHPNEARSAVADSLFGPWEELGNPCQGGTSPELTWGTQGTFLHTLPDGRILAMFDRWKPEALAESEYVWVATELGEDGLTLNWQEEWEGIVEVPQGTQQESLQEIEVHARQTHRRELLASARRDVVK